MKGGTGKTRSGTSLPTSRTEDLKKQKSPADTNPDWRRKKLIPVVEIVRPKSREKITLEENPEKRDESEDEESEDEAIQLPFVGVPPVKRVAFEGPPPPRETSIPDVEKKDKSYRNVAPVENRSTKDDWVEKVMNAPITFTMADLLGGKELREAVRRELTPKRVVSALKDKASLVSEVRPAEAPKIPVLKDPNKPTDFETFLMRDDVITVESLPQAKCTVSLFALQGIPKGSYIIQDPVEQYLNNLPEGEEPKQILVARESQSLRTLYPIVNGSAKCETIMDSGSQLVSMKEETAIKLGVCWSPDIKVNMQSANGSIESTLGLARNVPFCFDGKITLYFQVHIMKDPAYSVLLGRPFDAVGQSWIKNDKDGNQTITITDPNTGSHLTMPTYERGAQRSILKREPKPASDEEPASVFRTGFR